MTKKKDEKNTDKDKKQDPVELASDDSFPASDPPAWTGTTAGDETSAGKEKKNK